MISLNPTVMSFLDIKNPTERDKIVNEYLSTMRKIQQRTQDEKALSLATRQQLETEYSPITSATEKATKAITDELVPLHEEIKNLKRTPRIMIRKRTWDENSDLNAYDYYQKYNSGADKYFAIREEQDQLVLGDKEVHLDNNNIIIDETEYQGSPGLWRLLMLNDPTDYSDDDYHIYQEIARSTDLINNPQRRRNGRPTTTIKYTILESHEGHGIFLPGDIKGLEQKLNVLLAEYSAGNKTTRNEIVYILDELLRRKKISMREYTDINTFLQ